MKAVKILTLLILLAIVFGLFMMISWKNANAINLDEETNSSESLKALNLISPFFLGVIIVAIVGVLIWIASDHIQV